MINNQHKRCVNFAARVNQAWQSHRAFRSQRAAHARRRTAYRLGLSGARARARAEQDASGLRAPTCLLRFLEGTASGRQTKAVSLVFEGQ